VIKKDTTHPEVVTSAPWYAKMKSEVKRVGLFRIVFLRIDNRDSLGLV
jgi:hypothetical protein